MKKTREGSSFIYFRFITVFFFIFLCFMTLIKQDDLSNSSKKVNILGLSERSMICLYNPKDFCHK